MDKDRKDKLTPNNKRSLDETGFNPAELKPVATELLSDVAYAMTLATPATARAISTLPSDSEISVDDEAAGEIMYANSAVQAISFKTSVIAPLVKFFAKRRDSRVKSDYEYRSQLAGRKRLQHIAHLQNAGRNYLTWRTTEVEWPSRAGSPISPLELHLTDGANSVSLTSYEIKASGYIELVRACGKVVGSCNGDWLADQYMRMILTLSGLDSHHADRERAADLLNGGFIKLARETEQCDYTPLSGRDQHLAMTILASWIRMSRLGVDLSNFSRLEAWRLFFDGTIYGSNHRLIGEIWTSRSKRARTYTTSEQWDGLGKPPWLVESSGSPVVVIGIAAELLRIAITQVQSIGFVPDDADPKKCALDERHYEMSDKILTQLKRHYRDISGSSVGSVTSVLLTQDPL